MFETFTLALVLGLGSLVAITGTVIIALIEITREKSV